MRSKNKEFSPQIAARMIGVSDRTILNFINQKRFEALKVGREWYIDEASFISFCQRYNYTINEFADVSRVDNHGSTNKGSSAGLAAFGTAPEKQEVDPVRNKRPGVEKLRAYQHLLQMVKSGMNQVQSISDEQQRLVMRRCLDLLVLGLENLGSGYHAFERREKCDFYRKARSNLAAALALRGLVSTETVDQSVFFEPIEVRVVPSISALLRKLESGTKNEARFE